MFFYSLKGIGGEKIGYRKPENFCRIYVWFAWKSVEQWVIFVGKSVTNQIYSLGKV